MHDGEAVQQWVEESRSSFDKLQAIIETQRQRVHERLFREVADQTSSEREQIRELQEADTKIGQLLEVVKSQFIVLGMESPEDVARLEGQTSDDERVQEVIDRGSELVQWIEFQEASVTIWFAEAFAQAADEP